ncbi:MAG TPA: hypothetical protein VFT12_04825, partial [Thermoanaerobaculia bacterium]|nr:hypothetical protein [Thermoanaerobaculia bacterium]
ASVTPDATLTSEGAMQSVSGTCRDLAGNEAMTAVNGINIDKTAPVAVATRTPAPNASVWNNTAVAGRFEASDALSGISGQALVDVTFASEGPGQYHSQLFIDRAGNATTATLSDINIDLTAPVMSCTASPAVLWPPNQRLVPVQVAVIAEDALSGPDAFVLMSAISSEPDGGVADHDLPGDILGFDVGTPDTSGHLRAERSGSGSGRTYTITYEGADKAGNSATCSATVRVPHDQRP